jgi:formylglycine-generating enzyme required for sulfatase activity
VEAAGSQTTLPIAPSHFKGNDLHPVESVTWHHCVTFCDVLTRLLEGRINFCLPSEAEWEYACRAGTDMAYSDGTACTVPHYKDPALDRLGWFDKNSGGKDAAGPAKVVQRLGLVRCAWQRTGMVLGWST